jgi:hypothetical protein
MKAEIRKKEKEVGPVLARRDSRVRLGKEIGPVTSSVEHYPYRLHGTRFVTETEILAIVYETPERDSKESVLAIS